MRTRRGSSVLAVILVVALLAALAGAFLLWREAVRRGEIAEANARAMADTVRVYRAEADSLHETTALLLLQGKVNSDSVLKLNASLKAALAAGHATLASLQALQVRFAAVTDTLSATRDSVGEHGIRYAETELQGPPVEGRIAATIPPLPNRVVFNTSLRPSALDLSYAISCDAQHNAQANVTGPSWAKISLSRGMVDPNLCTPRSSVGFGSLKLTAGGFAVGTLLGVLVATVLLR